MLIVHTFAIGLLSISIATGMAQAEDQSESRAEGRALQSWNEKEAIASTAGLEREHVVRANFIQEKRVPTLTLPLVTKGQVVFSKHDGLLVNTKEPVAFVTAFCLGQIVQWDQDSFTRKNDTISQWIGRLVARLHSGDIAALAQEFNILGLSHERTWELSLIPKSAQLKRHLQRLELKGEKTITAIIIREASGVSTHFSFMEAQIEGLELVKDDQKYFKPCQEP